jgi:hypothetical protein
MSAVVTASLLPDPPARRHEEADLQAATMAYLAWALPPDAVAHHSPGEGKRTKRAQIELRRSGYQTGWPDIEVVYRGRIYFIELKRPKGGCLSAAQRACHRKLEYCDAPVMLCRSVPEVEAQLREACVPLRASVAA